MAYQLSRVYGNDYENKGTENSRIDHKLDEKFKRRLRDHAADPVSG